MTKDQSVSVSPFPLVAGIQELRKAIFQLPLRLVKSSLQMKNKQNPVIALRNREEGVGKRGLPIAFQFLVLDLSQVQLQNLICLEFLQDIPMTLMLPFLLKPKTYDKKNLTHKILLNTNDCFKRADIRDCGLLML